MHRCDRIPKIRKQPAPSHHRSPTRWQTVRGHGLSPITASRRSKIGPINSPRQHACKSRCDRIPEVSIQPAPSYHRSPTSWQTVRGHGIGPITASRRSKIGPINSPRQHACKSRYHRIPEVSKQPAPSHHRSPTRSQTVRGHGLGPITASRRSKIGHCVTSASSSRAVLARERLPMAALVKLHKPRLSNFALVLH